MIHIATVHYQSDRWIDIQLNYLKKHIKQPFRIYAFLCGDAVKHRQKFFYSSVQPVKEHAIKLNILSDIISFAAKPEDHLIFIDGDAFPVSPLDSLLDEVPSQTDLAAIVRKENFRDSQPHPSFCLTTVGFWKQINGDWEKGVIWRGENGDTIEDVGGRLMISLSEKNIKWKKILRTSVNPHHPVFFGLYGNIIYHHGAGFRNPTSRHDRFNTVKTLVKSAFIGNFYDMILTRMSLKNRNRLLYYLGIKQRFLKKNQNAGEEVYQMLLRSEEEFLSFINSGNSITTISNS